MMVRSCAYTSNVYTQHSPYVVSLLGDLAKGRLKPRDFPYTGADPGPGARFGTVIVFYVGGFTYEEAAKVAAINEGKLPLGGTSGGGGAAGGTVSAGVAAPFRVILGGTSIHSSQSFIAELMSTRDGGGGAGGGHYSSVDVGSGTGSFGGDGAGAGAGAGRY